MAEDTFKQIVEVEVKNEDAIQAVVEQQKAIDGLKSTISDLKKQQKEPFKETTTGEKFTPDQEESSALLLLAGIDSETSRRLILIAWENGHDSQYITDILGYVADIQPKNPAGYIRRLIERNNAVNPTSKGAQGQKQPAMLPSYHYYDNGGPELISHRGPRDTCQICQEVKDA